MRRQGDKAQAVIRGFEATRNVTTDVAQAKVEVPPRSPVTGQAGSTVPKPRPSAGWNLTSCWLLTM
jgi:hypothetical protein